MLIECNALSLRVALGDCLQLPQFRSVSAGGRLHPGASARGGRRRFLRIVRAGRDSKQQQRRARAAS